MPAPIVFSPARTSDDLTDRNLALLQAVIAAIGARLDGAVQVLVTTVATSVSIPPGAAVVRYIGGPGNTLTLPGARAQGAGTGQIIAIANTGTAACTARASGQDTINADASLSVAPSSLALLSSDGAGHWLAVGQVFGASGAGHGIGLVPDPGATAGATRFLREDGAWVAVAAADLTVELRTTEAQLDDLERRFRLLLAWCVMTFSEIPPGLEDEVPLALEL